MEVAPGSKGRENVDQVVRLTLNELLDEVSASLDGVPCDTMSITGPMGYGIDIRVRDAIELAARGNSPLRRRLAVILTTGGGSLLHVERMVDTIRSHYDEVDFIIPDMAMSAGTIFALSGDRIWMDYFSVLGPIDPQVVKDQRFVPALSYLTQFEELVRLSREGELTGAHVVLLQKLDLAELDQFAKEKALSVTLLKKWLSQFKFRNWNKTESHGRQVTDQMRMERAIEIANRLNDPAVWLTHGRGINKQTLEEEVGLRIDDYGANQRLAHAVRTYHRLLQDFLSRHQIDSFVHGKEYF